MRYFLLILFSAMFTLFLGKPASAEEVSLIKTATITAKAMFTNDSITLEKYLLTYEESADLSDKIKQESKADYDKERDKLIAGLWHEARKENIILDHVEIADVIITEAGFTKPYKQVVVAAVNPVFLHEGSEIRSHLIMLFVQFGGQWKYLHKI